MVDGGVARPVSAAERGRFLLAYLELLLSEGAADANGFRHTATADHRINSRRRSAKTKERWVINKLRALGSWYTKGVNSGSQLRISINQADSIDELRAIICVFFGVSPVESEPASGCVV